MFYFDVEEDEQEEEVLAKRELEGAPRGDKRLGGSRGLPKWTQGFFVNKAQCPHELGWNAGFTRVRQTVSRGKIRSELSVNIFGGFFFPVCCCFVFFSSWNLVSFLPDHPPTPPGGLTPPGAFCTFCISLKLHKLVLATSTEHVFYPFIVHF